ncbi:hypothetical protein CRUP_002223, partial [Coryphaenoides rupestris]
GGAPVASRAFPLGGGVVVEEAWQHHPAGLRLLTAAPRDKLRLRRHYALHQAGHGRVDVALGNGRPVPAVLLANKCDQRGQGLCSKLPKLESFSKDHGFVGWYETSAKVGRRR